MGFDQHPRLDEAGAWEVARCQRQLVGRASAGHAVLRVRGQRQSERVRRGEQELGERFRFELRLAPAERARERPRWVAHGAGQRRPAQLARGRGRVDRDDSQRPQDQVHAGRLALEGLGEQDPRQSLRGSPPDGRVAELVGHVGVREQAGRVLEGARHGQDVRHDRGNPPRDRQRRANVRRLLEVDPELLNVAGQGPERLEEAAERSVRAELARVLELDP